MTTSIYQNPFVFEKRGQAFSNYIALMIKHFNDKKDELGLTTRHHIKSKFLTNNVYDNSAWNVVHLLHEVHVEAHNYLKEAMPNEKGAIAAVNRLKGGCPRLAAQERWSNPEYIEKQKNWDRSERTKAIQKIECPHCKRMISPCNIKRHIAACIENPESTRYKKKHKIE
jgi:hypothetical protein